MERNHKLRWIVVAILYIISIGVVVYTLYGLTSQPSKIVPVKYDASVLEYALSFSEDIPYPNEDSILLHLIIGDSTAIIVKYPDSLMKITIAGKVYKFDRYDYKESPLQDSDGDSDEEPLFTPKSTLFLRFWTI